MQTVRRLKGIKLRPTGVGRSRSRVAFFEAKGFEFESHNQLSLGGACHIQFSKCDLHCKIV